MQIKELEIQNFKSIRSLKMTDVDKALIIVGKNSTGKTVILDAILAVVGRYQIKAEHFNKQLGNVRITMTLAISEDDLAMFHCRGVVSKYKRYDSWLHDFCKKLPSYQDGLITFTYTVNQNLVARYSDEKTKNNKYIPEILPKIHYIDHLRNIEEIQTDIFMIQGEGALSDLRSNACMFDPSKKCDNCFQCIPVIEEKNAKELTICETTKLLEHKLYTMNIDSFVDKLNYYYQRNSERTERISYQMDFNIDELFHINTVIDNEERNEIGTFATMSAGTKSIYILSLLEAYINEQQSIPSIIMIEDPEIYLHPQLQKTASEILYRLSKKNQVIFSTHSPNLLFNFNSRQIRQVLLDQDYNTIVNPKTDIDEILNDLGYSANDLMNVSFVFIVEGKQDSSRLPLLLNRYYSEIYDDEGALKRIAIIATNSCTNIKTYANLKYINKLYLKDSFLMIRDGDGKDANMLQSQLCSYYQSREREDIHNLPRVQQRNVLILKYYSFENYFLEPEIMTKIGVTKSVDQFYHILYSKYKEYLYRLTSVRKMTEKTGIKITCEQDLRTYFEEIKIYVRGHNLFDIFYGRYKGEAETDILKKYIEAAPRKTFDDILTAIDHFIYFESKKVEAMQCQIQSHTQKD